MVSIHERMAFCRLATCALMWCCVCAGCSHDLAQPPMFDPSTPLLPTWEASDPARPVTPEDLRSRAATLAGVLAVPAGHPPDAPALSATSPAQSVMIVPASYEAGPSGASDSESVSPPLALSDAIAFALRNNPRLFSAMATIERARGQETAAFAPFLPQIDMLNRYAATSKTIAGPGGPGLTGTINYDGVHPYSAWQSELQLQWTLYDFGRTAGRYHQAGMREKIAELQLDRARETVAYDVAAAYLHAREATALRTIAVESIRRAEAVLQDVRARREGGVALRDDVLRGEVQLSESRDALVRAEDAAISALAQLNNAMGRNASLPLILAEERYPGPFHATLADCLLRASTQRPEVGVARDRVAAAQFGRQAAKGEFLPRIYFLGSLGRVDGEGIINGWQEGGAIALNIPLYHGGANQGNLRAAEADISLGLAEAQNVLNDISLEVTVAHRGVVSAQARVELARPAVEQSTDALKIVRERYRNGTATPTDVIDAETTLTRSEQRYITSRIEYLSALARLAYVLGDEPGGLGAPLVAPEANSPALLPMPRSEPGGALPAPPIR